MLVDLLDGNAERLGGRTAILCGDERLSHAEVAELTQRLAGGLSSLGVEQGDCVVLLLPNLPEFPISLLAVAAVGAGAVLLDTQSKEHELTRAFHDCRPRAVITDHQGVGRCQAVAERLDQQVRVVSVGGAPSSAIPIRELFEGNLSRALPAPSPNEPLVYQYSSGSTGRPKRVGRTQAQCFAEAVMVPETLEMTPDDTILCAIPLFHAYGLGDCLFSAVGSGAALVIQPRPQPFTVKRQRTLELVESERVTIFPAVPYMFELLAAAPVGADLSSLRLCISAGSALPAAASVAFDERFGVPVRQLYGCTEAPSLTVNLDPDPRLTAQTVGQPMRGVEVVIEDAGGAPLPPGEVGEVAVRSPVGASGYIGDGDRDQQTFRHGWIYPGDLGSLDGEGRLTIAGRTKIFIEVLGHKVDPIEVEDVLAEHPAVAEAVVVGVPGHRSDGEAVKAAVVPSAPCSERELIHFCKERLSAFKVPQVVEFRESIPRSPLGKVLRKELV